MVIFSGCTSLLVPDLAAKLQRQNRVKYPIATVPEHATVTETTMPCDDIFLTT